MKNEFSNILSDNLFQHKNITENFLNSLIKNLYYTNILEQYSKILVNSNKIIKGLIILNYYFNS